MTTSRLLGALLLLILHVEPSVPRSSESPNLIRHNPGYVLTLTTPEPQVVSSDGGPDDLGVKGSPNQPSTDTFMPPDLQLATVIACYVGGRGADGADALVQVVYQEGKRSEYRVLLARRPTPEEAIEECRKWYAEVEQRIKEVRGGQAH